MAHDNQYKDPNEGVMIERYDYPKKGERFWNRETRRVEMAKFNRDQKALIVQRGN